MTDTSVQAEAVRLRALSAMTPARRLSMATGWSTSMRDLIRGNLKQQYPEAADSQLHRLFAERWLGPDLAAKVYGPMTVHG